MSFLIRTLTIAATTTIVHLGGVAAAQTAPESYFDYALSSFENGQTDEALNALMTGCIQGTESGYQLMCDAVLDYYENGTTGFRVEPDSAEHDGDPEAFRRHARDICDSGYSNACTRLARVQQSAPGSNGASGADAYNTACENGNTDACAVNGYNWMNGTYGAVNIQRAQQSFLTGCQWNDQLSCQQLAELMVSNRGGAQNREGALIANDLSCPEQGGSSDPAFCLDAAGFEATYGAGDVQSVRTIMGYLSRACDLRSGQGCYEFSMVTEAYTLDHLPAGSDLANDMMELVRDTRQLACSYGDVRACK